MGINKTKIIISKLGGNEYSKGRNWDDYPYKTRMDFIINAFVNQKMSLY